MIISSTCLPPQSQPRHLSQHFTLSLALTGIALLLPLAGCRSTPSGPDPQLLAAQARRSALESELRDASAEQSSLTDAIRTQTQAVEEISAHISADRDNLGQLETARRAFMQEHSVAVAAILAGAASTDVFSDRETSDDAKQVAVGVGVIALLWAATHQEELSGVINSLQAAKARRDSLTADMQQAQSQQTEKRGQLDELAMREDKARQKVGLLQTALCQPSCAAGT